MDLFKTALCLFLLLPLTIQSQVATTMDDFFLPGSQPNESGDLSTPASCSCHEYDIEVDAYFSWEGSMMAQSLRDQLFAATMSIAAQDADSSADLCLRCHTPTGWLSGRSDPPDGSALIDEDYSGVNCLFCHRMVTPFEPGVNPYPDDPAYSDPANSSTDLSTYDSDNDYISTVISTHIPPATANGMFVVTDADERRGPYIDPANPNHGFYYSPFHLSSDNCGTCHDVSNPVYTKNPDGSYSLNTLGEPAPDFDPYTMFPVERTYSEWKMSAYNTAEGVTGTVFGGNKSFVSSCQDCHMPDATGQGSSRGNAPVRNDLGLHDLTGGNTFMPEVLKAQYPDAVNAVALDSAISRATWMLQNAATMELSINGTNLEVRLQNETGHKLPSGYPEGRRMWLNIRAFDINNQLIYESGAYDGSTAILSQDDDLKVYEIKPGISNRLANDLSMTAGPSFHFVLNDTIYKDNRIPPRGFTNANFESIQSPPVGYTYEDGQYWDVTPYVLPENRYLVEACLYYQTTSKEYVEFLRDENTTDDNGQIMYDLWAQNGKSAPVLMVRKTWEDITSSLAAGENKSRTADVISLEEISPNPFNNQVKIKYTLKQANPVRICIYNISGKRVAELVNNPQNTGVHTISWFAENQASGAYIVHIQSEDSQIFKKIILLK